MQRIIVLLLCVIVLFGAAVSTAPPIQAATVTLLVFSSEANPVFTLNAQQLHFFLTKINYKFGCTLEQDKLGYQGFHISYVDERGAFQEGNVFNHRDAELFLLTAMEKNEPKLVPRAVLDHALMSIKESSNSPLVCAKTGPKMQPEPRVNIYIRGPDNVTEFDPNKWNSNSQIQYNNNCYNYGNDIRTDTFAQPGRGTGTKWQVNTCPNITAASERDGLIVFDHPPEHEEQPKLGHFIALAMWPNVNFHWYRKDAGFMWSHKPGSTAVRNVDNSGKPISDPRFANRGPYTEFCGYFIAIPSKVTIN